MNIGQVYEKFGTPKNLQEHMLRVAALSEIITGSWFGKEINKRAIIKACALHDIAKPINFEESKQKKYGASTEEIAKLKKTKEFIKRKYGLDEHRASTNICKDMGLDQEGVEIVDKIEWSIIGSLLKNENTDALVAIYCDMRVGPWGILSLTDRLIDLKKRDPKIDYETSVRDGHALEQLIAKNVNLDLNKISNDDINSHFGELLTLEI